MPATPNYDSRRDRGPTTDEEARQYIPQLPAALGLYEVRRQMGDSVLDAMEATLRAAVGLPEGRQEP